MIGTEAPAIRFAPGQMILHRHFSRTGLAFAPYVRVVRDDQHGLLLWMPTGSPVVRELAADGRGLRDMPFAEWITVEKRLVHVPYRGASILKLMPPGAAHAFWWVFAPDGAHAAWYVNLERVGARWDDGELAGVDIVDHDLDIWIWPDRTWEWKDEDELEERLAHPGHYWVTDADEVWAEGRRLVPLIEAGGYPFDGRYCDFVPEPGWVLPPVVPDGWDRPRMVA